MQEPPNFFEMAAAKGRLVRTLVDQMDEEHKDRRMIPVWFFVGVILLVYGVLILATGLYEISHPPWTVLANLHPAIWWGALLVVIGAVYVYLFKPQKR